MILTISDDTILVGRDISREVPHHHGPEAPWDKVLDGEGPPTDEDVEPPLGLTAAGVLIVLGSYLQCEVVGSIEEDFLCPIG